MMVSISVRSVPFSDKSIIFDMLQPYLKELSLLPGEDIRPGDDGLYQYPYLDRYWQERDIRFPYYLMYGNDIAGFALISYYNDAWDISEYYVRPEFRRRGVGIIGALTLLGKHRGDWSISYNEANDAGRILWNALAEKTAEDGVRRTTDDFDGHTRLHFNIRKEG